MDKTIRISEKAYKILEDRKDKTGISLRRQVDDLVFGKNIVATKKFELRDVGEDK